MAFGNQEAALLFKIKADSSDADRALRGVDSGIAGLGGNLDKLGAIAGTVSGIAAGAIAALGTAAAATAATLFSLARSAADYGSEIKDAADKTGVSTEALSALKVAADESGSSLEEVANATVKFSKLVGDAAEGSKQAKESLIRLGVDPQEAMNDLDAALEKVFKRINEAPPGIAQTKLATEAFGKAGANIIPVIKSFDGDMAGLIKRVKEMGLVFDQEAADAADEFGDTLDDLNKTTKGLAMTFAREFLPQVTGAMRSVQRMMQSNTSTAELWGRVVSGALADMQRGFGRLAEWANSDQGQKVFDFMRWQAAILTGGGSEALAELLNKYTFRASGGAQAKEEVGDGGLTNFGGGGKTTKRTDPRRIALEKAASILGINAVDLAALISYETAGTLSPGIKGGAGGNYLGLIQFGPEERRKYGVSGRQTFEQQLLNSVVPYLQDRTAAFGGTKGMGLAELYKTVIAGNPAVSLNAKDENGTIREHIQRIIREHVPKVLKQIFDGKAGGTTQADLFKDLFDEQKKLAGESYEKQQDNSRRSLELIKAESETYIASLEQRYAAGELLESEYQAFLGAQREAMIEAEIAATEQIRDNELAPEKDREDALNRLKVLDETLSAQRIANSAKVKAALDEEAASAEELLNNIEKIQETIQSAGDVDTSGAGTQGEVGWMKSWKGLLTTVLGDAPTLKSALGDIGAMFVRMFDQMAEAIGQVVQQWVLYGETGPAVMRKILASALATIAAESAVRAIKSLAWGFFFLATHQYSSAANAFAAAALFGSIAGATALAGRAIAGDAFKQTAAGGSTSSASSGSRGFTGGAYSGSEPMTVNGGRNAPAGAAGAIVVRDRSSGLFSQLFKLEWENNGPMRRMLVEEFG
ncbi:MAG TPA: hypothetical protein PKM58_00330 [Pyrinomonadaceae bacterium]|nr:hypothetical protein [Pyrinomonadaceae bacterium]